MSKRSQSSPWVFKDKPESRCLTTQLVLDQKEPILTVHHDAEDDVWIFWPYLPHSARDKAIVSTLERVVALHPFVREFADLPLGWVVVRSAASEPWTKMRYDEYRELRDA
jgi:hypothetical protein